MIVMINPPYLNTKLTNYITFKQAPYLNPAIALFAGLYHDKGIPYLCIDAKLDNLAYGDIITKIQNNTSIEDITFIGITISTSTAAHDDFDFVTFIKNEFPDIPIVVGGPHVTALPNDSLKTCRGVDIVVRYNGLLPLLDIYDYFTSQNKIKSLSDIPGIVFRGEKNKVVANAICQRTTDYVGSLTRPRWEDFSQASTYYVFSALGCPHRCSYCFNETNFLYGKKPVDMIIDELNLLINKFKMTNFSFSDPTFAVDKIHSKEVLQRMIDEGISEKVKWDCWTRVTVPDQEFCYLMKKAGCKLISLGVESGSNEVLRRANKGINTDQIAQGVKIVKESGIRCEFFLVFGQIGETAEDIRKTIDMAVNLNPHVVKVGIMTPWPGTEAYKLALNKKEGLELTTTTDYSKFDKYFGESLIHKNIDLDELEMLRISMYLQLYLKNNRYLELIHFAWKMRYGILRKSFSLIKKTCFKS